MLAHAVSVVQRKVVWILGFLIVLLTVGILVSSPGRLATNANGGPLSAAYGGSWQRSGNEGTRSNASDHKRAVILEAERDGTTCSEEWLLKADGPATGSIGRDFRQDPVRLLETDPKPWFIEPESLLQRCDIGCRQVVPTPTNPTTFPSFDAHIAMWPPDPRARARAPHPSFGPLVIRNNESPFNYPSLKLPIPKVNISMLCSLSSDVAVPGLPERFDLYVAPLGFERKNPAVAAFISNCHARSFRLEAIAKMRELGLEVHQYGECNRTHTAQDGGRDEVKIEVSRNYMFYAAFENSVYPDYVTEKVYHGLIAGSVPIYIGARNVLAFVPDPNSIITVGSLGEVPAVVNEIKRLMNNRTTYEEKLAWKTRGPTPEFRAHADLQTVSVTCKLCIEVATRIQERERARAQNARADLSALSQSAPVKTAPEDDALEGSAGTQSARAKNARIESVTRPCSCPLATTTFLQRASLARPPRLHHLYVRERGTFFYQDVFVRSDHLSVSSLHAATLEAFTKAGHIPTWKRWGVYVTLYKRTEPWRVYKVFPVRSKQRDILYGNASFQNEMGLRTYLEKHPCPLLEVIFI